jgi:hypothetical protein
MTIEDYVGLLTDRLSESYNVEAPWRFDGDLYALYAHSRVVAGKYILHKKITYERMEVNEHALVRSASGIVTAEQVSSFTAELRGLVDKLVKPSDEHMSTAFTGVLVAQSGFTPDAARKLVRSGSTRNF